MQVLIVRHAIAADAAEATPAAEEARALTPKGAKRMARGARGIQRLVGALDAIYTSPLVRTVETATLLSQAFGGTPRPTVAQVLAPGSSAAEVAGWLGRSALVHTAAVVGHEPGCSELLAYLTTGKASLAADFGKGAAALVDCRETHGALRGTLLWFASPRLLRLAGRKR